MVCLIDEETKHQFALERRICRENPVRRPASPNTRQPTRPPLRLSIPVAQGGRRDVTHPSATFYHRAGRHGNCCFHRLVWLMLRGGGGRGAEHW